ncbi:endonuclease [Legionella nautarum]|nr:endonuclease [Legionella nautarum]
MYQLIVNVQRFLLIPLLFLHGSVVSANPLTSFAVAKKKAEIIFQNHRTTLYCNCQYNEKKQIDLLSCQMQDAVMRSKRASRVEYEHMMPAEQFGQQFSCWREKKCSKDGKPYKGRKCCAKIDARFKEAEAELYNLWPAEGLVNQVRSNYRYGLVTDKLPFYGCLIYFDKERRKAEPDDRIKGLVARANLFMADRYQIRLSASQRQLFLAWANQFPPTEWEREWGRAVAHIEGYPNPYIEAQA